MRVLEALYRTYPSDPAGLPRFLRRLERLSGVPGWSPR